jgi:hypothetical protein
MSSLLQAASGKSLEYFDEESKAKFVPHVIEPSVGVDRLFLALLTVNEPSSGLARVCRQGRVGVCWQFGSTCRQGFALWCANAPSPRAACAAGGCAFP